MRPDDEIDHREDAAGPPVLHDHHATGGVGGFDLLGKILGDLELKRLVQAEHETGALVRRDDVCGRSREPLAVRTGRHHFGARGPGEQRVLEVLEP